MALPRCQVNQLGPYSLYNLQPSTMEVRVLERDKVKENGEKGGDLGKLLDEIHTRYTTLMNLSEIR